MVFPYHARAASEKLDVAGSRLETVIIMITGWIDGREAGGCCVAFEGRECRCWDVWWGWNGHGGGEVKSEIMVKMG